MIGTARKAGYGNGCGRTGPSKGATVGSQSLSCQDARYGWSPRLRHFALLCRWLCGKEACCSSKYRLELEQKQESAKQGPHGTEQYSLGLGISSAHG